MLYNNSFFLVLLPSATQATSSTNGWKYQCLPEHVSVTSLRFLRARALGKVYGRGTCTYLLSTLTADHWQAITYAFVGARRSRSRSKAKVSEGLYHLRKVRLPIGKSGCAITLRNLVMPGFGFYRKLVLEHSRPPY